MGYIKCKKNDYRRGSKWTTSGPERACQEVGVKATRISLGTGARHLQEQVGKAECTPRCFRGC